MTVSPEISALIAERSKAYGKPSVSMECLAAIWSALLQHHWQVSLPAPITPHMAALMLANLKVLRATMAFNPDNYHDCAAFMSFAESLQERDSFSRNGSPEGLPHALPSQT